MFIRKLKLKDFRLFSELSLLFSHKSSIILAPNACGKSSVIEAIYLLASGNSSRAQKLEEMISFQAELGQVSALVLDSFEGLFPQNQDLDHDQDKLQLSILLTRGLIQNKRTNKQHFSVNDNKRRKKDYVGHFFAVMFQPEDMRLVEGSPTRRRDYLNNLLSQVDREYRESLARYNKTLLQRNRLLSQIKDSLQPRQTLTYWNMSLIRHGEVIQKKRRSFIDFVNAQVDSPLELSIDYQPSIISQQRLDDKEAVEIAVGHTLIGPHKDDFFIQIHNQVEAEDEIEEIRETRQQQAQQQQPKNIEEASLKTVNLPLYTYGSRGQKRMGVLWLKKAELAFIKYFTNQTPVLLLDDILSELDAQNRKLVFKLVDQEQVITTTTDPKMVAEISKQLGEVQLINLDSVNN